MIKNEMVVWMPPSIPYVILDTRLVYRKYVDAVCDIFVYNNEPAMAYRGEFNLKTHMSDVGMLLVSTIKQKNLIDRKLEDIINKNNHGYDEDDYDHVKRHFGVLVKRCEELCMMLNIYDGQGNLDYGFWDWRAGALILAYVNHVIDVVPANHWLADRS